MRVETSVFYDYFRSSAAYRLRIALALKGLTPARTEMVDLRTGAQGEASYKSVTPTGLVPALADGDERFSQSLALIEWLDSEYPETRLVPADAMAALASREIAYAIACDIHPVNNLRILNYLTGTIGADEEQKLTWYHHWIKTGFDGVEALIGRHRGARREAGPFCLGAYATIADICLVPQVYNAKRFAVDLAPYPLIQAVNDHCLTLPAFADTAPGDG